MAKQTTKRTPKARVISPEVVTPILNGEYELVDIKPKKVNTGYGNYDLGNLSQEEAEFLVKKGFNFIRKKLNKEIL